MLLKTVPFWNCPVDTDRVNCPNILVCFNTCTPSWTVELSEAIQISQTQNLCTAPSWKSPFFNKPLSSQHCSDPMPLISSFLSLLFLDPNGCPCFLNNSQTYMVKLNYKNPDYAAFFIKLFQDLSKLNEYSNCGRQTNPHKAVYILIPECMNKLGSMAKEN